MATLTKIIRNGNSQAVRIPASMRMDAKDVEIHPIGYGFMVIDPAKREKALDALRGLVEKPARGKRAHAAA